MLLSICNKKCNFFLIIFLTYRILEVPEQKILFFFSEIRKKQKCLERFTDIES